MGAGQAALRSLQITKRKGLVMKVFCTLAVAGFILSACSVYVDGAPMEHYGQGESSLTIRADSDAEMTVKCKDGREPYSKGGENGEPLVMGCRDIRR